jgi:TatD DNase family protein
LFIDTHTHLFMKDYPDDFAGMLHRASEAGVEAMIVPGTTLASSTEAVQLSEKYSQIYAMVGIHPLDLETLSEQSMTELERLVVRPKVVAVGEIGLDYHYDGSPHALQQEIFRKQIELAVRYRLPVCIHARDAMADTLAIVRDVFSHQPQWRESVDGFPMRGVFHCFAGTAKEALELRDLGFWVSFTGAVTFRNSPAVDVAREMGIHRLFLETDAPYMTPIPHRGKRNEPAYVPLVAQKIAEIVHCSVEEVGAVTTQNARRLFEMKTITV